jgi:Flp pilus assembly protein TadG
MVTLSRRSRAGRRPSATGPGRAPARGQAMVEFAAVLLPILLIVVAIVQFGLLFGANVTLTNAVREAARAATIQPFDLSAGASRATNDLDRCTAALDAAFQSFGLLSAGSPHFVVTDPCPAGSASDLNGDGFHDRWVNGDMTITLCASMATPTSPCPTTGTYCTVDVPTGCLVQVKLTYRSDIVVPFMGALLPHDANGRFVQEATTTMVVN